MDADSTPACLTVKIMEADYSVTSATGTEHTVGDGTDVLIIVEHGTDDDLTFGNFDDLSIDGKTVGAENYNKENGSLKLTLKAAYLDTLSVGDHKVTISFTDGTVETSLKIKAAAPPPSQHTTDVMTDAIAQARKKKRQNKE